MFIRKDHSGFAMTLHHWWETGLSRCKYMPDSSHYKWVPSCVMLSNRIFKVYCKHDCFRSEDTESYNFQVCLVLLWILSNQVYCTQYLNCSVTLTELTNIFNYLNKDIPGFFHWQYIHIFTSITVIFPKNMMKVKFYSC